jgi:dTDP-4-amino-4,6-dideoxygalactose transaminase
MKSEEGMQPREAGGTDRITYVTRPFLPPLAEFLPHLEAIWARRVLTNCGPLHQQLERELAEYLGVPQVSVFNNGTIALMVALRALGPPGDVITTPYSFVATANSILWAGGNPVFVDLEPGSFNIDPAAVEAAITPRTTAILAVHCYGNPCAVHEIEALARRRGIRVIYDAAHAFGVRYQDGSVLNFGDLSVLSFHATKVFNTFEGGAIVCRDTQTKAHIDRLRNFGFVSEDNVVDCGLNGKMNEFQAALGLVQLKHQAHVHAARKQIDTYYRAHLTGIPGIQVPPLPQATLPNFGYFPILVDGRHPLGRDGLWGRLKEAGIFARRYFYPIIPQTAAYTSRAPDGADAWPRARKAAAEVLCLPIFPDLDLAVMEQVVKIVRA